MGDPTHNQKEPLARSLGRFFGHLAHGFTADVSGEKTQELSRTVEEEQIGRASCRERV